VLESRAQPEEAIACHREAEELSRRIGNRLRIALSLGNRANLHVHMGDLDRAMACYEEAEAIARELGAKASIALIVGNRGSAHSTRGEFDKAIVCHRASEAIARELGDTRRLAFSLGKLGSLHGQRGESDRALACFEEAEQLGEQAGDPRIVALHQCLRGRHFRDHGRAAEATEALRSGLEIYDGMNANRSIWYFGFKCDLAGLEQQHGDEQAAIRLARDALELAAQLGADESHPDDTTRQSVTRAREILSLATEEQERPEGDPEKS
jgi:tetratricopeptide (TPR) repeat protein